MLYKQLAQVSRVTPYEPDPWLAKQQFLVRDSARLLFTTSPSSYLQFGGVGRDVAGNLDHFALLTNEDCSHAMAGMVLASRAAHQDNQQAGKDWRHLCLHICARLLHFKRRSAETSPTHLPEWKTRPRAGTNLVALGG